MQVSGRELNSIHAKVLGIWSEGSWGPVQRDVEHVAADTGAVDAAGDPIALRVDRNGDGLGERVVSAVEALARSAPMRLAAAARDDPTDAVDATGFIARIVPSAAGGITHPTDPAAICAGGLPTEDTGGDEKPDLFSAVLPGTPVCFDIILRKNSFVKPLPVPQLFKAHIDLWGDNVTLLDTREVFFLVPAEKPGVR